MEQVFFRVAYKLKATVVMFNAPFDLSRLAIGYGKARGLYGGGFSLKFWDEERFRPRVTYKTIDSKRSLIGFSQPSQIDATDFDHDADGRPRAFRGNFLDLRTLAFAHTNTGHSLETGCEAFGVEHGKQQTERHGMISDGYIKAYLAAMGIKPVLQRQPDIPPEVLGWAMSSFYGGRAECHIRRAHLPVQVLDVTSMYPTVDILMGLTDVLTAENHRHPRSRGLRRVLWPAPATGVGRPPMSVYPPLPNIIRVA